MTSRKRRKKPPDPRLSPFDFLLDSSLPVDLTNYLIYFGFDCRPVVSPALFSTLASLRVSFAPTLVPNFQNRGSRSANFERRWHDWHIRTPRFDPFVLICLWQTQVSSRPPPLFITVFLGNFRVSCLIVVWCSLYGWYVYRIGLPWLSWSWIGLRFFLKNLAHPIDFLLVILWHLCPWFTEFCESSSSPLVWLRSYVVKFPVSGTQVSLFLDRLRARIRRAFAHLGFVGATLAPSNVMLNVSPEWNIPPPPSWRPYSQNHLAQHATVLWLDSCFLDQPLFGGWTVLCILCFHGSACFLAENLIYIFVYPWTRASSYFLLSLSQAGRYAQQYVILNTCCCWHLDPMLRLRDEVKVECLFVYDEYFSETESACLMLCLYPPYCDYCPGHHQITRCHEHVTELWIPMDLLESGKPALKAATAVSLNEYYSGLICLFQGNSCWQYSILFCTKGHSDQWNMSWSSCFKRLGLSFFMCYILVINFVWIVPRTKYYSWWNQTLPSFYGQQIFALIMAFRINGWRDQLRSTEILDYSLHSGLLRFNSHCKLCWYPVNDRTGLHCIHFNIIFCISRSYFPSDQYCNYCDISASEQRFKVLGPCLLALALHLRMHETFYGPYYSSCIFLARVAVMIMGCFVPSLDMGCFILLYTF